MSKLTWHTEQRKISDLIPFADNPRRLTDKQAKDLKKSLEKFGLVEIPAIDTDNKIIAGHQRLKIMALLERGEEMIDVRVPNRKLTDQEFLEYNLRSNKNTGEWDFDILANWDEGLLNDVGFDAELDKIFSKSISADADDVPEPRKETDIKTGYIFKLGNHRVMCGDSTDAEQVAKLMDGKKADMVFTDPPYNVAYGESKNPRHHIREIANDKMSTGSWVEFNQKIIDIIKANYTGGDIYVWGASGPEGMRQRLQLCDAGFHWSATIIWKKQQLVLSPAKYQRMYEPCYYGWLDKSSYIGDRKNVEVWEIDRPLKSVEHPTMKPVALCAKGIGCSSDRGGQCLIYSSVRVQP